MIIRPMEAEDISSVLAIEEAVFSRPWKKKDFLEALCKKENIYYVAQREDIVGYIGIWTSFETADLCNMAVAHEVRRCKVGDQLLKKGLDEARKYGVTQMLLEVRESNVPAIHLYQKNGFLTIGNRKNYYHAPEEDALLMQCRL